MVEVRVCVITGDQAVMEETLVVRTTEQVTMEVSIAAFGSAMMEPELAPLCRPRCDHLEQRHEDLAGQSRITPSGRPGQPGRGSRGVSVQGG